MKRLEKTEVSRFISYKNKRLVLLIVISFLLSLLIPEISFAESGDEDLYCTYFTGDNVNALDYSNGYPYWSSPIKSYLTRTEDGYMKVQAGAENKWVIISYYDSTLKLISRRELSQELPLFGAFYETSSNYYIVSGQENPSESDSVEVYRITKYDKSWNRIKSCGLYGANTYIPFDAGNCRIDTYGSYMIIRTCHEMYAGSDGTHHQANVTIQVDMSNMKITDSYTSVRNANYGYVSHSFNQFIKIDNNKIVSIDHGDAHPRSIVLMNYPKDITVGTFQSTNVESTDVMTFPATIKITKNFTGASVGGFELSDTVYLVAGNAVKQDDNFENNKTRNVFIASINKSSKACNVEYLTDYSEGETTTTTPHMLKLNDNKFFVIWSQGNNIQYVFVDKYGNKLSDIYTKEGQISDCDPISDSGNIIWYTWNNSNETFYKVPVSSPENMTKIETIYDHDYQVIDVIDGIATLECKKCHHTKNALVPVDFSDYWNNGTTQYYSYFPQKMDIENDLKWWINSIQYNQSETITEKLGELVVELEDPSVGTVNMKKTTISWTQAGTHKVFVYSKYNPSVRKEYSIKVVKPIESVSVSAEQKDYYRYDSDVTFIAVPDGGRDVLKYRFVLIDSRGNETILQDYGNSSSYKWTMNKVGTFDIRVDVKDTGDNDKVCSGMLESFKVVKAEIVQTSGTSILGEGNISYGQAISELAFGNYAFENKETGKAVPGTISWTNGTDKPNAGSAKANWKFVPSDKNYKETSGLVDIEVEKADPVVTRLPVLGNVTYNPNSKLSDITITNGTVNINGTWSWKNGSITPTVKVSRYDAVFVPDDKDNYNNYYDKISLKVNKATPYIKSIAATSIVYGQSLADSSLTAEVVYSDTDETSVSGKAAWKDNGIKPVVADSQTTEYGIIFTPDDKDNYETVEGKVKLNVEKAEKPSVVPSGTKEVEFTDTSVKNELISDYPGWEFNKDDIGTELTVGKSIELSVLYVADDAVNYNTVSSKINIYRKPCTHKRTELREKKDPTCTENGYSGDTYCLVCGEKILDGETSKMWGHEYGAWKDYDENDHIRYCVHDNKHFLKEAHEWDDGTITTEPTTYSEGVKTFVCKVCHKTRTEAVSVLSENDIIKGKDNQKETVNDQTDNDNKQENKENQLDNNVDQQDNNDEQNDLDDETDDDEQDDEISDEENRIQELISKSPSLAKTDKLIKKLSDKGEVKGSSFSILQANAKKVTKNKVTLKWNKVNGAEKYIIYGNRCGKKYKYKKLATVKASKTTYTIKKLADKSKLKKGTYYKFLVVAVTEDDEGISKAIATSKSIHLITNGKKKYTNFTGVKIKSKKKLSIKVGKKSKIKASQTKKSGYKVNQHRKLSYESSDPTVATVSKTGVVKGKSKGTAKIYVYTQSGKFAVVNIAVK